MDNLPRQKLKLIIANYGVALHDDSKRCEALLRDFCGQYRQEISVLINAQNEKIPAELLNSQNSSLPISLTIARLIKRLEDNQAIKPEAAKWSVESWALALNIITEAEIVTEKPVSPPPVPSPPDQSSDRKNPPSPTVEPQYRREKIQKQQKSSINQNKNHTKKQTDKNRLKSYPQTKVPEKPKQIDLSVVPELIFVEGGTCKMGRGGLFDNRKAITLNNFSIGKYPVTVKEYKAYCRATGKQMLSLPNWNLGKNFPMIMVCWYEAIAYCEWLSKITNSRFRLPTEAEWEFAARGGLNSNQYKWAGSNNPNLVAWFDKNSNSTHPVGEKQPNELGIFDMSGNVFEWCFDWLDAENKVIRGGSWKHIASKSKVFETDYFWPGSKFDDLGFRVARD